MKIVTRTNTIIMMTSNNNREIIIREIREQSQNQVNNKKSHKIAATKENNKSRICRSIKIQ